MMFTGTHFQHVLLHIVQCASSQWCSWMLFVHARIHISLPNSGLHEVEAHPCHRMLGRSEGIGTGQPGRTDRCPFALWVSGFDHHDDQC